VNKLEQYRALGAELRAEYIAELRTIVRPHISVHAGYCGLVCDFFPKQARRYEDPRHPRARPVRFREGQDIIGFYDGGVIDKVWVGLLTRDYAAIELDELIALVPVAKRFARERTLEKARLAASKEKA
jgi:hypothetical protein